MFVWGQAAGRVDLHRTDFVFFMWFSENEWIHSILWGSYISTPHSILVWCFILLLDAPWRNRKLNNLLLSVHLAKGTQHTYSTVSEYIPFKETHTATYSHHVPSDACYKTYASVLFFLETFPLFLIPSCSSCLIGLSLCSVQSLSYH